MNQDITLALLSMGYRRRTLKGQEKGMWLKPIAHQCFVFNETEMRWYNMFVNIKGKLSCWNSHEFKTYEHAGSYVQQLKGFEWDTRTNLSCQYDNPEAKSEFEFLDLMDHIENLPDLQEGG